MTTPTSMGNHGGTVTSCSPYAYPGFAEICILHRTWSTVALGTYELAFLIKKKKSSSTLSFPGDTADVESGNLSPRAHCYNAWVVQRPEEKGPIIMLHQLAHIDHSSPLPWSASC